MRSGPPSTVDGVSATAESCLRCGAAMQWLHQTWQCPRCRFKLGCCEGGEPCEVAADSAPRAHAARRAAAPVATAARRSL